MSSISRKEPRESRKKNLWETEDILQIVSFVWIFEQIKSSRFFSSFYQTHRDQRFQQKESFIRILNKAQESLVYKKSSFSSKSLSLRFGEKTRLIFVCILYPQTLFCRFAKFSWWKGEANSTTRPMPNYNWTHNTSVVFSFLRFLLCVMDSQKTTSLFQS